MSAPNIREGRRTLDKYPTLDKAKQKRIVATWSDEYILQAIADEDADKVYRVAICGTYSQRDLIYSEEHVDKVKELCEHYCEMRYRYVVYMESDGAECGRRPLREEQKGWGFKL